MKIRRLLLIVLALSANAWAQNDGLKIFISSDMEGVVGAVTAEQLRPGGFEYERFRGFMTAEVNAAIEAARAAGATEIVVADSHGNAQNLLIERLPQDVTVVRSWPREFRHDGRDRRFLRRPSFSSVTTRVPQTWMACARTRFPAPTSRV